MPPPKKGAAAVKAEPVRNPHTTAKPNVEADIEEQQLRPVRFGDFTGQRKIVENLEVFIQAAKTRAEALDHVLLFGPPGLGKCITADSLILTDRGLVPFDEILPPGLAAGESTTCEVRVCGIDGLEPASHLYSSGFVPTRRLRTSAGFEIEGTPHHPLLVATPDGPKWRPISALQPGDHVAIACGTNCWGEAQHVLWRSGSATARRRRSDATVRDIHGQLVGALDRLPTSIELNHAVAGRVTPVNVPQLVAQRLELPLTDGRTLVPALRCAEPWTHVTLPEPGELRRITLDADLAYLLGMLVGDGHFEKRQNTPAFTITCTEPELQAELQRISRDHFGIAPEVRCYGDQAPLLRFSQSIGQVCLKFGAKAVTAAHKTVPAAVLTGPREVAVGFLQGLFDADGTAGTDGYVAFGTRSERLARQVQLMLANLGIIARRNARQVTDAPFWQLFIGGEQAERFHRQVGFRLTRKRDRSAGLADRPRGWSRADRVPCANVALSALLRRSGPHPRALHKVFGHVTRDDRTPSRTQVARYLSLLPQSVIERSAEQAALADLSASTLFWDRIETIEASAAEAFDFVVPGTHSFVANGFYNHNTTLSHIIANEMGVGIKTTSGPVLDKPGDLAGLLTNLDERDVLFIDEIHRLNPIVEEYLYSAMEDFTLDIMIDAGPSARSVQLTLPRFTLIGATTRAGSLTAPLLARFGITSRLDYYDPQLLQSIIVRAAHILGVEIDEQGAMELARRSRGTPRIANRLLRRARDFAQVRGDGIVTAAIADYTLNALEVDREGLDEMDKRILTTIIDHYNGGPVGVSTIAVAVGEEPGTIEEVYEPYLIQIGFLKRTLRGREATDRAYRHLGRHRRGQAAAPDPNGEPNLFES